MNDTIGQYYAGCFGIRVNLDVLGKFDNGNDVFGKFMQTIVDVPGEAHLQMIQGMPSEAHQYLCIKLFTLFVHEGRHWVDLISTPFGHFIHMQILSYYVNGYSIYEELTNYETLYAPLNNQKNVFDERVVSVVEANYQLLNQIDHVFSHTITIEGKEISSVDILEALAILQQEIFIGTHLDKACVEIFKRNIKDEGEYYFLLTFLRDILNLEDLDIYQFLYLSLFGYKNRGDLQELDVTPPRLLKLFVERYEKDSKSFKMSVSVTEWCDQLLQQYQGYTSKEAFDLADDATERHKEFIRANVDSMAQAERIKLLVDAYENMVDKGFEIGNAIRSENSKSLDFPFCYYWGKTLPVIYFESLLGLTMPEEKGKYFRAFLGHQYNPENKEKILSSTLFKNRSVIEAYLSQIPNQYGVVNIFNLFTIDIKPEEYFMLIDLYPEMLYIDLMFKGRNVLKSVNMNRLVQKILDKGQLVVV